MKIDFEIGMFFKGTQPPLPQRCSATNCDKMAKGYMEFTHNMVSLLCEEHGEKVVQSATESLLQ